MFNSNTYCTSLSNELNKSVTSIYELERGEDREREKIRAERDHYIRVLQSGINQARKKEWESLVRRKRKVARCCLLQERRREDDQ